MSSLAHDRIQLSLFPIEPVLGSLFDYLPSDFTCTSCGHALVCVEDDEPHYPHCSPDVIEWACANPDCKE